MRRAYTQARRNPSEACYVEMHATGTYFLLEYVLVTNNILRVGTAIGDPTEANWVGKTYRQTQSRDNPLFIGSVKGNIG